MSDKDRSLADDFELMVDADETVSAALERADGDTIEFTDDEQETVEAVLGFFNDAVDSMDESDDIDSDTDEARDLVAGRDALERLADNEGDSDDAKLALKHIAGFGRAMQETIIEAMIAAGGDGPAPGPGPV